MVEINVRENCSGCSACYCICPKSAITMTEDSEGFLYPKVNKLTCIDCGLCEKVCPLHNSDSIKNNSVIHAYVAHHKDVDIWYESSSGGAFSAITEYIFNKKGIVYGAVYDTNFQIVHDSAENYSESLKFRGSKYAQSRMNDTFKEIKSNLNIGKNVLFSGTPCQVAGLKSFLHKDFDNLITVDLICHCVPSPMVFKDYITFIEEKHKKKIARINMKDKTKGWPVQSPRIYFEDGSSLFGEKDSNLWESIFYSYLAIRPSCHKCPFANLNRVGDITIGDYWGVEKFHPNFNNPNGASIILINSQKGHAVFDEIVKYLEVELTDAIKALPSSLIYTTKPHPKRNTFWEDYYSCSFEKICKKYFESSKKQILLSILIRIKKRILRY